MSDSEPALRENKSLRDDVFGGFFALDSAGPDPCFGQVGRTDRFPSSQRAGAEHVSQIQDHPSESRHSECHAHGDQTQ